MKDPEQSCVLVVLNEHLQHEQDDGNQDQDRQEWDRNDEAKRRGHRAKVCADVERVGGGNQEGGQVQDGTRETLLDQGG